MGVEQTVAILLNMLVVQIDCGFFYYVESIQDTDSFSVMQIVNLIMFAIGNILLICFFCLNIKFWGVDCHRRAMAFLSQRISQGIALGLLLVFLVFVVTSCACIFYSFFQSGQNNPDKWIYQMNTWVSLTCLIYLSELIKTMRAQSKPTNYAIYLMILLLAILYASQVRIFTEHLKFGEDIYFQIALLLISLKIFWDTTPFILHILILTSEIISLLSSIRFLLANSPTLNTGMIAVQSLQCVLLFPHAIYALTILLYRIHRFIKRNSQVKQEGPMKLSAILSLEKIRVSGTDDTLVMIGQKEGEVGEVGRRRMECSICTMEIPSGSEVYTIPCGDLFHCGCLREWLLIKNSCPNCRTRVE